VHGKFASGGAFDDAFDEILGEVSDVGIERARVRPNILLLQSSGLTRHVTLQCGAARDMLLGSHKHGHLSSPSNPNDIKTSAMISFQAASRSGAHRCGV
jgi:hypothetical protein